MNDIATSVPIVLFGYIICQIYTYMLCFA